VDGDNALGHLVMKRAAGNWRSRRRANAALVGLARGTAIMPGPAQLYSGMPGGAGMIVICIFCVGRTPI